MGDTLTHLTLLHFHLILTKLEMPSQNVLESYLTA